MRCLIVHRLLILASNYENAIKYGIRRSPAALIILLFEAQKLFSHVPDQPDQTSRHQRHQTIDAKSSGPQWDFSKSPEDRRTPNYSAVGLADSRKAFTSVSLNSVLNAFNVATTICG